MCPKCKNKNINTWYSGGKWKAQCNDCLWHGLLKSIRANGEERVKLAQDYIQEMKEAGAFR